MNNHPQSCRCRLHQRVLDAKRTECYRRLAKTILGPTAPDDTLALAHALSEHAKLIAQANSGRPDLRQRKAA